MVWLPSFIKGDPTDGDGAKRVVQREKCNRLKQDGQEIDSWDFFVWPEFNLLCSFYGMYLYLLSFHRVRDPYCMGRKAAFFSVGI
jgi:hypothetical protein